MAITSVGSRGTKQQKSASQVMQMQPNANIAAGQLLVVWVAWFNNNAGTPDNGPISEQHSCIDGAENVYTTLVSGQNRGSPTGTSNGVHSVIHVCQLQTAITTAHDITVRLGTSNSLISKAMSLWEFSLDAGYVWSLADHTTVLSTNVDPGAISLSGMGSREYLLLHVLGARGPNSDTYTWDSDYTEITGDGTTGGVDTSNISVRGGFRIATLTGDTVDVTSTTADRVYHQGLAAIYQFQLYPDFPTTPILDDFNRANEDPLTKSGAWYTGGYIFGGSTGLAVSSNLCKVGSTATAWRGQWYDTNFSVAGYPEVYATCNTAATGFEDGFGVGLRGTLDDSSVGLRSLWEISPAESGQPEDGILHGFGDTNDVVTYIIAWSPQQAGDKMGIQMIEQEVSLWLDKGGGWFWTCAFLESGPHAGNGYLSLLGRDQVVRMDDFGGGVREPFIPQIYRRVFG